MSFDERRFNDMKEAFLNLNLRTQEGMDIFNEALAAHGFRWVDGHLQRGSLISSNALTSERSSQRPHWNANGTRPLPQMSVFNPPGVRIPPLVKRVPMEAPEGSTRKRRKFEDRGTSSASISRLPHQSSPSPSPSSSPQPSLQSSPSPPASIPLAQDEAESDSLSETTVEDRDEEIDFNDVDELLGQVDF
ncbi:hypothetical protein BD560DRAFT_441814 [Blakeslea trispora]|nr:hypothetical protein BD560DRAFT_441814 [Blakeslea trispora]